MPRIKGHDEFDGVFDKDTMAQMENEIEKEALEPDEPKVSQPEWKRKLIEAKARAAKALDSTPVILNPTMAPTIETIPGDPSTPQTPLEAHIEADRKFARNVIDTEEVKAVERSLSGEALFHESLAERVVDRDRFKRVFIDTIQLNCAGHTIAEIENMIRERHETLYDVRAGIQAMLSYRAELLKDATAEERAKALQEDFLYKPVAKPKAEKKDKAPSEKKTSDPFELMAKTMKALGKSDEEIKKRLDKLRGM